jgi:hypothetical protein
MIGQNVVSVLPKSFDLNSKIPTVRVGFVDTFQSGFFKIEVGTVTLSIFLARTFVANFVFFEVWTVCMSVY